ncbi:MAG: glycosyltransferase family 9 protein, partial [Candidatus Thermochlorobacter sp.]
DRLLEQLRIQGSDELIAMAAAAGSAIKSDSVIKTAPAEKFIEVTKQLQQNNPRRKIFYIGAPSERQYVENMQICDGCLIFNLCGMLSLRESAELLRRCRLLISNDSGATHLASALGIKHIVWFGATDDVEFGPYRNPNAVVYRVDLPCAPCRENECTVPESHMTSHAKRPFCLTMIDARQVTAIAEQMLQNQKATPSLIWQQ